MNDIIDMIKKRPEDSHKGTFGSLKILCGSSRYTGAALLCCEGALRSGCGIVRLFADENVCLPVRIRLPEVINSPVVDFKNSAANAAVIGCGISDDFSYDLRDIILNLNSPSVIDADGINFLSLNKDILREADTKNLIFTPHPKEFSRLTGVALEDICGNREYYAKRFSDEYKTTLVLKGHRTVIASYGKTSIINTSGCSGLAKGGSGDILAGVIGSLLAQGYDVYSAAAVGVYVHGKAGEILSEKYGCSGVIPSDLPKVIGKLLG